MGLRMKNFNILGVHWKIWFLRGSWKANIEGGLPKKGAWTVCRFKGGGAWEERGDGVNTQSSWIIRTISGCLVLLELFADLRGEGGGAWEERGGGAIEGWLIPQCTLWANFSGLVVMIEDTYPQTRSSWRFRLLLGQQMEEHISSLKDKIQNYFKRTSV